MSDARAPDISVVIPAYNAAAFVGEAIASVRAQTLAPLELLVVDDASTDTTAEIARASPGVRYLRQPENRGQAAALNRGVAETSGAYLAFLDADDLWRPRKLERQRAAFDADPSLDAVYGLAEERVIANAGTARDGRKLPAPLPSALLVGRAAFERVGGFDEQYRLGSVVDWYSRALASGLRFLPLEEVLYERRIHGANVGLTQAADRGAYLDVVRAALARRRQSTR